MTYPDSHYDEDDECQCPDHVAMREARLEEARENMTPAEKLLDAVFRKYTPKEHS
jgi:hypothetical protein